MEHLPALPPALMAPVTAALGLPVTVTTLYTPALGLSAWSASIAFRRYLCSYRAALLGGLVHGFSAAMIAQSSSRLHLTLGAVLPPLILPRGGRTLIPAGPISGGQVAGVGGDPERNGSVAKVMGGAGPSPRSGSRK